MSFNNTVLSEFRRELEEITKTAEESFTKRITNLSNKQIDTLQDILKQEITRIITQRQAQDQKNLTNYITSTIFNTTESQNTTLKKGELSANQAISSLLLNIITQNIS